MENCSRDWRHVSHQQSFMMFAQLGPLQPEDFNVEGLARKQFAVRRGLVWELVFAPPSQVYNIHLATYLWANCVHVAVPALSPSSLFRFSPTFLDLSSIVIDLIKTWFWSTTPANSTYVPWQKLVDWLLCSMAFQNPLGIRIQHDWHTHTHWHILTHTRTG